jgi:signal transduction histidine kinase
VTPAAIARHDRGGKLLAAILASFGVAILLVGLAHYRRQVTSSWQAARDQLTAIADLKAGQIARWRSERLNDARWLLETRALSADARDLFATPGGGAARDRVWRWLQVWQEHQEYSQVLLLDTQIQVRLAAPAGEIRMDPCDQPFVEQALRGDSLVVVDLHRDSVSQQIRMGVAVPLLEQSQGAPRPAPVGVVLFEIDPAPFLFALIKTWPTPSHSAETLLVRQEGDDVVYLNELRHRANTALNLRFPLTNREIPAVRLMLGEEGIVEGIDYRGVPSLAAIRRIPDSPWGIVAKVDRAELDVPLRRQAWTTAMIMGALLLAVAMALTLLWHNRENRFMQHELEERERLLHELETKNEELEAIVYAASHDLRAPLVNIEGFSHRLQGACLELESLLRRPDVPSALREEAGLLIGERIPKAMRFIHSSVGKMADLISGLLRVSRVGSVAIHPQRLDMDEVLRDVIAAQAFQIEQARADVRVEPLPPCAGDRPLVNQVFSNLLDNALKYRDPARALWVSISGQVEDRQAIYTVADTGRGIAAEHQKKIWVLFHRLHPDEAIPGDGLGLKLVRRIVDRHGGRVWVTSSSGQGSKFYVALPVEPPPAVS